MGNGFSCATLTDGTVQCWGLNGNGQLGDGTTTDRSTPVQVSGITTATQVSFGTVHACATLTDGTIECWGENGYGRLGDGTTTDRSTPVQVFGITTATHVSVSDDRHSCALLTDGTVQCWGHNSRGQLGDGTTTDSSTPVQVSGITTAAQVSSGDSHSCAALQDGTVQCWGYNPYGQLGDGTTTTRSTPVQVSGITTATQVSASHQHSCATLQDGTVQCWGRGANGRLGDGTNSDSATPVQVSGITTAGTLTSPPPPNPPPPNPPPPNPPPPNAPPLSESANRLKLTKDEIVGIAVGSFAFVILVFLCARRNTIRRAARVQRIIVSQQIRQVGGAGLPLGAHVIQVQRD